MTTITKQVGNTLIKQQHSASCHCGSARFLLDLPDGFNIRHCNCLMCTRRAIIASVRLDDLQVVKDDTLTLYQFNTYNAKHYFCRICGIHTHHQYRSNSDYYDVNVGYLEGVQVDELKRWAV